MTPKIIMSLPLFLLCLQANTPGVSETAVRPVILSNQSPCRSGVCYFCHRRKPPFEGVFVAAERCARRQFLQFLVISSAQHHIMCF